MIIYLHQRNSQGTATANAAANAGLSAYYDQRAPYHQSVPDAEIRHVYVNEGMTVNQVVQAVTTAAHDARSIWQLMINCHGSPGSVSLGRGVTAANATAFSALRDFMSTNNRGIVVGCCYAAAGQTAGGSRGCLSTSLTPTNGLTLLIAMARNSGAEVMGGIDQQFTWDLNGPLLTVRPNGTYGVTQGRVLESVRTAAQSGDYRCTTGS